MSENLFETITLSNGKTVEFKNSWTRKMDKEYTNILFEGVSLSTSAENIQSQLTFKATQNAEEYCIRALTNLSQKDIDDLEMKDYNDVKARVEKILKELKDGSSK
jgi:hypothetical protein